MSSKIIPAGELQGQALPTLQFASFGQITPNSRLARVAAAVTPKVTLPASVDLGALLAAAGVDDPTAQAVDSSFAADPVEAINDSLPPSMQLDADGASALLAPVEGFDESGTGRRLPFRKTASRNPNRSLRHNGQPLPNWRPFIRKPIRPAMMPVMQKAWRVAPMPVTSKHLPTPASSLPKSFRLLPTCKPPFRPI